MKKISIVIPVYNGEKYIKHTINNILQSTYKNLEIILVNDGSADNSLSICEKLKNTDSRIYVYTKINGGIVSARNYGVSKATGDYLCFCDQDDIVEKETYNRLISAIMEKDSDICMCSVGRSIENKKSLFEISEDAYYEGEQIHENLLYPLMFHGYKVPVKMSNVMRYPFIWNCMFCMTFWKQHQIKFRSYVNFEDDLLVKVETLSKATKISTISYVGYYWNVNLKSETYTHKYIRNIKNKQQKCYEDMFTSVSEKIHDKKVLELFKQVTFCNQYIDAIHNLSSPFIKKNNKFIREYYRHTIYDREFLDCIVVTKYLKKEMIKSKILLTVLSKKMTMVSYIMEILLNYLMLITLHSPLLTRFERKFKKM